MNQNQTESKPTTPEQPADEGLDETNCSQCAEWRQLADDALNTLRITREKYGIGDRHVMREKNREIAKLREALEAADECLALIEDVGHGAHMDNVTVARGIVTNALCPANSQDHRRLRSVHRPVQTEEP
jgi:hypothetical protein